jgi:hypothetical protein
MFSQVEHTGWPLVAGTGILLDIICSLSIGRISGTSIISRSIEPEKNQSNILINIFTKDIARGAFS